MLSWPGSTYGLGTVGRLGPGLQLASSVFSKSVGSRLNFNCLNIAYFDSLPERNGSSAGSREAAPVDAEIDQVRSQQ